MGSFDEISSIVTILMEIISVMSEQLEQTFWNQ